MKFFEYNKKSRSKMLRLVHYAIICTSDHRSGKLCNPDLLYPYRMHSMSTKVWWEVALVRGEGISGLFLCSRMPREPGSDTARLKASHAQPWLLAGAFLLALRTHLIGGNCVGSGPLPAPNNSPVLTSISTVM